MHHSSKILINLVYKNLCPVNTSGFPLANYFIFFWLSIVFFFRQFQMLNHNFSFVCRHFAILINCWIWMLSRRWSCGSLVDFNIQVRSPKTMNAYTDCANWKRLNIQQFIIENRQFVSKFNLFSNNKENNNNWLRVFCYLGSWSISNQANNSPHQFMGPYFLGFKYSIFIWW